MLFVKILKINTDTTKNAVEAQQTKTVIISSERGKIYDRNLSPITGRKEKLIAAISPTASLLTVPSVCDSIKDLEEKISKGHPFVAEVKEEIDTDFAKSFYVPVRYSDSFCCHLTGYIDKSSGKGLSGIEKAYNSFLEESSGTLSVTFEVDAYARALPGLNKYINDDGFSSKAGIVLTVESKAQKECEASLANSKIESGCAVVMHIDTGEIYALASVPTFDRNDISKSLKKINSPLLNKALQSYSVGSIFKPILAACALENGISETTIFNCTGSITIGDTVFKCYNEKAHGKVDMKKALENSCNTYFINLLNKMDLREVLETLKKMGFNSKTELCDGLYSEGSRLPLLSELSSLGEKANFSFGQGKLLASPLQILCAYHTLATGNYVKPSIIYGFTNEQGLLKKEKKEESVKIFSTQTVNKIKDMLFSVVENGNATNAKSDILSLCGKTGTAQSGSYEEGKEILRTWFAGFFPYENPHYIVVVLNEKGTGGNYDCADVFRNICEKIALAQ